MAVVFAATSASTPATIVDITVTPLLFVILTRSADIVVSITSLIPAAAVVFAYSITPTSEIIRARLIYSASAFKDI